MEMHERCPVCAQVTDIEVGFYYGTGYVSYVIALLLTIVYFLVWLATIGFSFTDKRFLIWIISNSLMLAALQPWLMRLSRVIYIRFFVSYDEDYEVNRPKQFD